MTTRSPTKRTERRRNKPMANTTIVEKTDLETTRTALANARATLSGKPATSSAESDQAKQKRIDDLVRMTYMGKGALKARDENQGKG